MEPGKNKIYQTIRKTAANGYKSWTLHHLYPKQYRKLVSGRPVKPNKIVFLEVREKELSDNFQLLWEQLEQEGNHELKLCCIREGMQGRSQVRANCLAVLPDLAEAAWIVVSDSCYLLSSLPLRPETKVLQTWHACGAFKKFGYSVAEKKFGASQNELDRFPVHRNFSYVTVSSAEVVWAYAEAFHMEDRKEAILPLGISRTDVFFREEYRQAAREKLQRLLPDCAGKKILLYAPTFRGRVADAVSPDKIDWTVMRTGLGAEYFCLCKHHPFVKKRPVIPADCLDFARDVTEEMTIEELLMVSDVCISDYSSLIFEYSLFGRPMLFFSYDLEDYFDWRGFYYDYDSLTPGPVCKTTEEMVDYIQHLAERFDLKQITDFREKFMSACDGRATKRLRELMQSS